MFWIFNRLEREIRSGSIPLESYLNMLDADNINIAGSLIFLERILLKILKQLNSGHFVIVRIQTNQQITLNSRKHFFDWIQQSFPNIYQIRFNLMRY
jgi:hypothetical protein